MIVIFLCSNVSTATPSTYGDSVEWYYIVGPILAFIVCAVVIGCYICRRRQRGESWQVVTTWQILEEIEKNIVICRWRANQQFPEVGRWGKWLICETMANHDIFRQPSWIIILLFYHQFFFFSFWQLRAAIWHLSHKSWVKISQGWNIHFNVKYI